MKILHAYPTSSALCEKEVVTGAPDKCNFSIKRRKIRTYLVYGILNFNINMKANGMSCWHVRVQCVHCSMDISYFHARSYCLSIIKFNFIAENLTCGQIDFDSCGTTAAADNHFRRIHPYESNILHTYAYWWSTIGVMPFCPFTWHSTHLLCVRRFKTRNKTNKWENIRCFFQHSNDAFALRHIVDAKTDGKFHSDL